MRKILLLLLILNTVLADAQKEASVWCFGEGAGIDFNNTSPVAIKSAINTLEGCSGIADKNGQLLFYTDGVTIWNKNHQAMQNGTGLLGLASSTQSALIIRKPGSLSIYYVFTADGTSNALNHHMENGYRYSIVDMNLNGGLGDVTAVKNVLLYAPSTEKLAAVKQADGVNIWLVTHEWNSSKFRVYSITCDGIDTNAVVSDVGVMHEYNPGLYYEVIGQMKCSPDGKRLAVVNQGKQRVQVFDFNNTNGIISKPINILSYYIDQYVQPDNNMYDFENVYGVEFSPNSKVLYLSCIGSEKMFQYDLTPNTSVGISATGVYYPLSPWCISNGGVSFCPGSNGGLQLGPDGKIYMAYRSFQGLNVVEDPNTHGPFCNFKKSIPLNGVSSYGLPTFLASYFDEGIFQVKQDCKTVFVSTKYGSDITYRWDFGDHDNKIINSANASYTYSKPGKYPIRLILSSSKGCSDTLQQMVEIPSCVSPEDLDQIKIPNVFTPNGDGVNDVFSIQGLEKFTDNEITIFDRWGKECFHQRDYNEKNVFSGSNCNDGVYYYIVNVPSVNFNRHGFVTIVR